MTVSEKIIAIQKAAQAELAAADEARTERDAALAENAQLKSDAISPEALTAVDQLFNALIPTADPTPEPAPAPAPAS